MPLPFPSGGEIEWIACVIIRATGAMMLKL